MDFSLFLWPQQPSVSTKKEVPGVEGWMYTKSHEAQAAAITDTIVPLCVPQQQKCYW